VKALEFKDRMLGRGKTPTATENDHGRP
jgi:hypothetical protein